MKKIKLKHVELEKDDSNNQEPYYVIGITIDKGIRTINPYAKFFNSIPFNYFFFLMVLSFNDHEISSLFNELDYDALTQYKNNKK